MLWELHDKPITISAGKSKDIDIKFQDQDTKVRLAAKNVSFKGLKFDVADFNEDLQKTVRYGVADLTMKPTATGATLTFNNRSGRAAVVTDLVVQGQTIRDFGEVETVRRDAVSQAFYGRRPLKINIPCSNDQEQAVQIAEFELQRRASPRGTVNDLVA